jgi:transcriptional regulator with XRE-family HTH domain
MTIGPDIGYHTRLKRARLATYLTQEELAEQLGISVTTVKTAENGTREISATRLFHWADICGVNLDWIATGKGEPRRQPLRRRA